MGIIETQRRDLQRIVSVFAMFLLCWQPILGQKSGQNVPSSSSKYPDFKKPQPYKNKDGKVVEDAWDVTICKGTDFVFPISGPEVTVSKFTDTAPSASGDATAQQKDRKSVV